jgi:uncharacterized protein YjbJ (UPF0337 family)
MAINTDIIQGKWAQLKGEARVQWAKLTDDDLEYIGGQREKLAGRLQERYGWTHEDVERELEKFFARHEQ